MSGYDYLVIVIYLACMLGGGFVFRQFNHDAGDYFRGGGNMLWWICGSSAFMSAFSAWSFTGAAGKIYETGTLVLVLYAANFISFALTWAFFCYRFRQMRVVTNVEAIRDRFGRTSEQFYTWLALPLGVFGSGIGLNAVAVFVATALGMDYNLTMVTLGVVITTIALTGGAWAVAAMDFVQMLLVISVSVVAAILAVSQPAVGGLGGMLEKVPDSYFRWSDVAQPGVIVLWVIALLCNQIVSNNNMGESASRYLMVRDSKQARRAALIPAIGILIAPLVWLLPSMSARITHPDLGAEYPHLANASEVAFVAVCLDTLPQGMMGLLVCGIFAATLTTMDTGLNRSAGIFVMNFYKPYVRPEADSQHLLWVARIATLVLGVLIISMALLISTWRTMGLFDLVIRLAAAVSVPMSVPMLFGMFHRKSPPLAAWSTALFGMLLSLALPRFVTGEMLGHLIGLETAPNTRETTDLFYAANIFLVLIFCTAWYWVVALVVARSPIQTAQVEEFFTRMNKPVIRENDAILEQDVRQYRVLARICFVWGGLVSCGVLIPNDLLGRACFIFCGGLILAFGTVLTWQARKISRVSPDSTPVLIT